MHLLVPVGTGTVGSIHENGPFVCRYCESFDEGLVTNGLGGGILNKGGRMPNRNLRKKGFGDVQLAEEQVFHHIGIELLP